MKEKKEQLIFRNEWKHSMDRTEYIMIRGKLAALADESMYAGLGGMYRVRSLAFAETEDGKRPELPAPFGKKESFRIRYYNENADYIRLEKKTWISGKSNKQSLPLSAEECKKILSGDIDWMEGSEAPLLEELCRKLKTGKLAMQTVADFQREAFVYRPCNVRITMDSQLRTGIAPADFFNLEEAAGNAAPFRSAAAVDPADYLARESAMKKEAVLMEIKYDCFLPEVIRAAIRAKAKRNSSFERYEGYHAYGQA